MSRRWWRIIFGLILFLALAFTLWFYFSRENDREGIFEASGTVRGTEVTMSSKIAGKLP